MNTKLLLEHLKKGVYAWNYFRSRNAGVLIYLADANLRGKDLEFVNFHNANLQGADLRGAALQGADLQGADLQGADLQGADLRGADLRDADLRDANLRGADLRDAALRGADLRGADFKGAYLEGAHLGVTGIPFPNVKSDSLSDRMSKLKSGKSELDKSSDFGLYTDDNKGYDIDNKISPDEVRARFKALEILAHLQQASPISLVFDLDVHDEDQIANVISQLSDLYNSFTGDRLVIAGMRVLEVVEEPEGVLS